MRMKPENKYDEEELARLNAKPWQVSLLDLNPEYPWWGPGEDYMSTQKEGWDGAKIFESWSAFGPWKIDELNEVVNFYFSIERDSKPCDACSTPMGCSGYNPETHKISEDFYDFARTGRQWFDKITEDEVEALIEHARIGVRWNPETLEYERTVPAPTAAEINAINTLGGCEPRWTGPGGGGVRRHDAINKGILIETRARRLGVYGVCPKCEGRGAVFTAPEAHAALTLWFLHPRKGCSRGVKVRIDKKDLPQIWEFLRKAADRNAARFAKVAVRPEAEAHAENA